LSAASAISFCGGGPAASRLPDRRDIDHLAGRQSRDDGSFDLNALEREFSAIAGIDSITSVSGLGIGRITVQFNLNRSIDAAAQDIQAAIGMPHASSRRDDDAAVLSKGQSGRFGVLQLTLVSQSLPLSTVNEFAEINIGQRLSTLPGVAQVVDFRPAKICGTGADRSDCSPPEASRWMKFNARSQRRVRRRGWSA